MENVNITKIAFVVQNETHAQNAVILYDRIMNEYPECSPVIILMDGMTGMDNERFVGERNVYRLKHSLETSFPKQSRFAQFLTIRNLRLELENLVQDIDILIFGNDGAPERLMAKKVQDCGGKAVMLLDGFLLGWPDRGWQRFVKVLKRDMNRALGWFIPNYYLPSLIGQSKMDLICVMHDTVADVLRSQGVKAPIEVVTLPRHDSLVKTVHEIKKRANHNKLHVLYVTGAWAWHRCFKEESYQQSDIMDMVAFASEHKDSANVKIRIHPRDEIDNYKAYTQTGNFSIGTASIPIAEDLAWADCLVTARSSMLLEAVMVGVPGYIYTRNFPVPAAPEFLFCAEVEKIIPNLKELLARRVEGRPDFRDQHLNFKSPLLSLILSDRQSG